MDEIDRVASERRPSKKRPVILTHRRSLPSMAPRHTGHPDHNKKGRFMRPFRNYNVGKFYTENEDPQPQVVLAFGLRIIKRAPCKSST